MVFSIRNGFYKINFFTNSILQNQLHFFLQIFTKFVQRFLQNQLQNTKSIFRLNYARCEKMLRNKIVHFKWIYKLKIKNLIFSPNFMGFEKMLQTKVVILKTLYKYYIEHFLVGIIDFLINI